MSRVLFNEITPAGIQKAMAAPTVINKKLVDAQRARRVLDRLVGYKVSQVLWDKVRRGLSAGPRPERGGAPHRGPRAGDPGLQPGRVPGC